MDRGFYFEFLYPFQDEVFEILRRVDTNLYSSSSAHQIVAAVGNRAITLRHNAAMPERELKQCIAMALTYHLDKKQRNSPRLTLSRKK